MTKSIRFRTAFWSILSLLAISARSRALTISSGPTFTPAANAPLAGLLQLATDEDSRVSVLVSDGTNLWERDFYDFATNHSLALIGFGPGRTNLIQVTVYDKYQTACTAEQLLTFVTGPLPPAFPTSVMLKDVPDQMEPGYTLFMIQNRNALKNYVTIMDNTGTVVWYCPAPALYDVDVRQLDDGNIFITDSANRFLEVNLLGQTVRTWNAPAGYPVNLHDGVPTGHGTILYLSDVTRTVSNFPSSDTVSNAPLVTANVDDNPVVEISYTNAALLNVWSPLDMLDPTRVTYLTYQAGTAHGVDNEHANALIEDPANNSIIVSLRNQNAVFEFSRATGKLEWIIGPPANWSAGFQTNLFTPAGAPFEWNYGQHAPMLTPQGTVLLYDDGNLRASPFDATVSDQNNYSRAVEYGINRTNMQISQVWDSTAANDDRLYTGLVGKAQWLPVRRNVLVTYGFITYVNGLRPSLYSSSAGMVRIIEYTHDPVPEVVFDLSFFDYGDTNPNYLGYFCYRSTRIPDLYSHAANPVTDLVVSDVNRMPRLEFSADPVRTYIVQASTDLANWTAIGPAVEEGGVGNFEFNDLNAGHFKARFYRVVTQ
jgi:arylsulfate sulfotransferase